MDRITAMHRQQQRAFKRATREHSLREQAEADETLRDERALQEMPDDIHLWATTPHWDDVTLFNTQTCREAP